MQGHMEYFLQSNSFLFPASAQRQPSFCQYAEAIQLCGCSLWLYQRICGLVYRDAKEGFSRNIHVPLYPGCSNSWLQCYELTPLHKEV